MERACPRPEEWRAFSLGDLDEERLEALAVHLEDCIDCQEGLARWDDERDGLAQDLSCLGTTPLPEGFREEARLAAQGAREGFDPGRRLAGQLTRGPVCLGRFELERVLGAGSFGQVFLARDRELDRHVALKVARSVTSPEDERARLVREARRAAQLEHPGIVRLHEVGEAEGVSFLVCEYVAGETLEERLRRSSYDARAAAELVAEVARALAHAHEHGVVHRDVKPSNILLDSEGHPHLADFGLAKREQTEETATPRGVLLGTPAYMPPELAAGEEADARSDVYSLGVILYELLTGDRPFHGNRRLLMLRTLEEDPRPPRQIDARIPRALEIVCLTCLRKPPSQRYVGAAELAQDLERYLAGESIRARPPSSLAKLIGWARRQPLASSLIAAGLLGSWLGFTHLTRLSRELVRSSALDSASQYADMLETVNEIYSSEVVERIGNHDVEVTADYAQHSTGAIPLPATLLTELLDSIRDRGSGMRGRHFSRYPYPFRENGGARDDFEEAALTHLTEDPGEPYYRYTEDAEGRPVLRYTRARIMGESCVACHNYHPQSPKRDWKVGDVRGVLEVVRDLDRDEQRIRSGLRGTSLLVGLGALALLALGVSAQVLGERRRAALARRAGR